jgi:hypothetical protein
MISADLTSLKSHMAYGIYSLRSAMSLQVGKIGGVTKKTNVPMPRLNPMKVSIMGVTQHRRLFR